MKTTKKLVLAALAASCVVAGAMGLSACGGEGGHVHTYSTTWTAGETQPYYAATCGHSNEKLAAADHVWGLPQVTSPATETTKGSQTVACVVCGKTKTESIDYAGHTYSDNWTVSETHHWHAATCAHTELTEDEAAHTWGEWKTVVAATHTNKGVRIHSCTVCNYAETDETDTTGEHTFEETRWAADANGHYFAANCGHDEKKGYTPHNWVYVAADNAKTEAEGRNDFAGYHQKKCDPKSSGSTCGYVLWEQHSYTWEITQQKTCTQDGISVGTCACGFQKTSITSAGHTYASGWTSDETHHWHAVACEHTDAPLDKKAHEWNDVQITEEGGVKYATKECTRCHYVSKTEVTGVTAFDFKIQKTGTGSSSGKPTGNAVYIENNEVHILPNTVMNFDFINFAPADDSAFAEFKTNYKKIKVYEVTEGDVKTELTSSSEPALIQLDWRTASGKDVVFFQLKVTDGQSHKICVETEFASKEFTVIPDAPSTINVKYSLDNGTTWNDYTSTIRSGVTVGQTVLFTADLAGYTVTPPASGGTLSENSTVTPPEGFSGVYALTPTEAATVSITLGDGKFASASVRVKATAAA